MISFLVETKKNTYASINHFNEARVESSRLESKDLEYEAGEFNWFQGSERIYYEDDLIYELYYHGGKVS